MLAMTSNLVSTLAMVGLLDGFCTVGVGLLDDRLKIGLVVKVSCLDPISSSTGPRVSSVLVGSLVRTVLGLILTEGALNVGLFIGFKVDGRFVGLLVIA